MEGPMDAVIEHVTIRPNKVQPIIVNFQNGELKEEEASNMKCGIFYDEKKKKRVLAMSNGQIVYKGYRPDFDQELTYTMLAIHNKRTGKVRLVHTERWQLAPILDKEIENSTVIDEDKIVTLNKQFGSKKVKRRTLQMERMKMNVETVKEQLEKSVSKVEIERADLTLPSLNDESVANTNLPECHRDASEVEDVYNINDIVPHDALETLYDTVRNMLEEGVDGKSLFFRQTFEALKSQPNNVEKIAILLYIDAAASWLNMPIKDAKKRGLQICPYSTQVNTHIINSYSMVGAHGRQRSSSMRDKGIMHCMILALMILNFTLDLEVFATLLNNRIGRRKLNELARFISAVPIKDKNHVVVLKLPLPAQLVVAKKGKKK